MSLLATPEATGDDRPTFVPLAKGKVSSRSPGASHSASPPARALREPSSDDLFAGRLSELATLSAALRRALDGEGGVVLVVGETGMGKTRLVREFAHRASDTADVHWGVCEGGEGAPPFWVWEQVLRGIVDGCDPVALRAEIGAGCAALAAIFSDCPAFLGDGVREHRTAVPAEASFQVCDATRRLIAKVAARRPLVLVLDDLQWVDCESLRLLQFVSRYVRAMRVLVVGLCHADETRPVAIEKDVSTLVRHGRTLRLRGLSIADVRLLIEDAGPEPVTDAQVALVHDATGGNPLIVGAIVPRLGLSRGEGVVSKIGGILEQALAAAQAFDMRSMIARVQALLGSAGGATQASGPPVSDAASPSSVAVPDECTGTFRREGDYWTLGYGGVLVRLRDSKGLRCLALLLTHPQREIHVEEVARVSTGSAGWVIEPDLGPVLDRSATRAYKQRLLDLRDELAEATLHADLGRASRVRDESDRITEQLLAAYGLGGRHRNRQDATERVRKAVTNQVRRALDRVSAAHPALGRHLENGIRTGTFCSYRPEPGTIWRL